MGSGDASAPIKEAARDVGRRWGAVQDQDNHALRRDIG
jgi:hypothetical protein